MRKLLIIVFAVLLLAPAAAFAAGGTFTDDDTSVFEADIEWLAGAGVTLGCNPPTNDNYCPNGNVSRGQMAAFMRRFAAYLGAEDGIVSEADHAATADTATTAGSATTADSATTAGDADLLDGLSAEDLIDASPVIVNAADFTPDGFAPFGDFHFGWSSTAWVYQQNAGACLQAPVSIPHGASLTSAEIVLFDADGDSQNQYFNAELGDPATVNVVSGFATASATSQTVTLDLTGLTASNTVQHWIGICLFDSGDSLYGARVFYTVADAALAGVPREIRSGEPVGTPSANLP